MINTPTKWKNIKASELFKIQGGAAFKSEDSSIEGIRWLKIANVGFNIIKWDDLSFLPQSFKANYENVCLKENDIVVAMTRPLLQNKLKIAKISKKDLPCLLNQRVGRILPNSLIDKDFLYQILRTKRIAYKIESDLLGTDPPNLSIKTFNNIYILLPPLPEQRAIAEILTTWDAAIEKMERLIEAKEKRFKAKSEQMISRDFHHDEFLLGDICEIFTANSKTSEIIPDGKFIIADMGAVSEKGELLNRKRSVNNKDQLNIGDLIMPKDDIGGGNIIGKVAYVDNDRVVLGDHVYALRFTENINSKFLFYQINGQRINRQLRRMSNGTSQLGLGKKDVKKQKIYLPDIDEQNKVVEILDNLKKEITLIEQIKEYYKAQKHGLMQKLLTGEWRVRV